MRAERNEGCSQYYCAKSASYCFVRTGVRHKFSVTEHMAADVSKDVIELHGAYDQQNDRPIVPIVRHVAKMAKRASEKSEAEQTQTNALNVALRLIGDQPTAGNQRDCQRKQRNKEPIPIVQHRKGN